MSSKDKLNAQSPLDGDAPPSESYSVGQLAEENENDSNNPNNSTNNNNNELSLSPSPAVKLNRQFDSNPFKNRSIRSKFLSNKHDTILKQYSSTHFSVASTANVLSSNLTNFNANDHDPDGNNDSSDSSDDANEEYDVDDTAPNFFEFPYVMFYIVSDFYTNLR